MVTKKKTVGQHSVDMLQKEPETRDPILLEREMHREYENELFECVKRALKVYDGDFFVVVITKQEPLMPNVYRNYFFHRQTCPTPDYDQTVYHYVRRFEVIRFIWVVPSRDTCHYLKDNALIIAEEERDLLKYVLEFADGTLFKRCKELNGEKEVTPELRKD